MPADDYSEDRGQTDRVAIFANSNPVTWTFNPHRAMDITHTHSEYHKSIGSNAKVETDGRTRPIALPSLLKRWVITLTAILVRGSSGGVVSCQLVQHVLKNNYRPSCKVDNSFLTRDATLTRY